MSVQPSTEATGVKKTKLYTLKCQCQSEAPLAMEKPFFALNTEKTWLSSNFQYIFDVFSVIWGSIFFF